MEHRYSIDTDRCACGGLVVYFEDGDRRGLVGEGCEVAGSVWDPTRSLRDHLAGRHYYDPAHVADLPHGALVHEHDWDHAGSHEHDARCDFDSCDLDTEDHSHRTWTDADDAGIDTADERS